MFVLELMAGFVQVYLHALCVCVSWSLFRVICCQLWIVGFVRPRTPSVYE